MKDSNTTKILNLLETANKNGVIISFDNNKLNVNVLKGKKIDKNLLQQLKINKENLITYFKNFESKDNTLASIADLVSQQPKDEKGVLSFAQERLWFIDRLEGSTHYHIPAVLRLNGELNKEALAIALSEIVDRHEVLRTVIQEDNQGIAYQQALPKNSWSLEFIEQGIDAEKLDDWIAQKIQKPFLLSADHMLRATLLKQGVNEHLLVVVMHHIAADGWSMPILVNELIEIYHAMVSQQVHHLKPLAIQYADFAKWQRNYLQGETLQKKLNYWIDQLRDLDPLNLATDFPRPAIQSTVGASMDIQLDPELVKQAKNFSQKEGTTLFMTLLAVFKVLLHKYTHQDDICVGSPIANRTTSEVESLIGFFVNTLALRSNLSGNPSFNTFLTQVKQTTLDGYSNQEVPFEKIVQEVEKTRDRSRSSLFQALFTLQNTSVIPELKLGEVTVTQEEVTQETAKFDLTFTISEHSNGMLLTVQYCSELFLPTTIQRMMGHYQQLLKSILTDPNQKLSELSMLTQEEEAHLLSDFSMSTHAYPKDRTIIDLFEEQVEKTPDNIALVFEDQTLTYRQFNDKANQLAHYLRSQGVREESLVTICMERSMEVILAIMGVVKSGAAFVPIDPEYPQDRINYIIKDTKSKLVITNQLNQKLIDLQAITHESNTQPQVIVMENDWAEIANQPTDNLPIIVTPDNLIYLIYTSGSTGRPKGVMLEHGCLLDHLFDMIPFGNLGNCKSFALSSSVAADGGHSILFAAFMQGSTMHILSDEMLLNSAVLRAYLNKYTIDCMKTVPSLWTSFADDGLLLLPNETLILGGEAFSLKIVEQLRAANYKGHVYNNYGPTETTIGKLMHLVDVARDYTNVPIGKPFSNTQLYVVDHYEKLCPIGVPGELWIGGDGVSRGYLNRDELTKEKYIQNPFPNAAGRIYKSGDFVKWLPDGNIEFLGRIDHQVQIRGYRVELGEIETVLQQSPKVSQGVVLAKDDPQGNKRLIAYIVPHGKFDKAAIQSHLETQLPDYMVPKLIMELSEMPLTTNAKVNKKALPEPDATTLIEQEFVAAQSVTEKQLVSIWQNILQLDRVGIHANFFELGGHSLMATRVISAIRNELEVELPIKLLFANPTVATLAKQIDQHENQQLQPSIEPQVRPTQIPLSFSQERLWFIDKLEGSVHYHVPTVLRFKGNLDKEALQLAFSSIINRHEVLRTTFQEHDGLAYQEVLPKNSWQLEFVDRKVWEAEGGVDGWIRKSVNQPFDLSKDHMLRAALLELISDEHVLLLNLHHIASDGWSVSVFVKEFIELYQAAIEKRQANLAELPVQYADYSIWQRNELNERVLSDKLTYWLTKLSDLTPLNLPLDFPRPAVQSTKGNQLHFKIEENISKGVKKLAQTEGTTLFMTLLSAFKVLLYRYTNQTDVCVGSPIANRTHKELESLIGFFVNTLALRSDLSNNPSFTALLQQVKATTLDAYAHQDVPFEKIVEQVEKVRDRSRNPLFQVMFILQNTPESPNLQLDNLSLEIEEFDQETSKFDLIFNVVEAQSSLDVTIEYCSDLFLPSTIEQLMRHFEQLLVSIIQQPQQTIGQIPMLSPIEEQQLLVDFNDTKTDEPQHGVVIDLFENQVSKSPHANALTFNKVVLTYQELNEKSNRLAHYLKTQGLEVNALVGICMDRSLEMIVSILGVLKAGGTYVPMDPNYPKERMKHILEDTAINFVLTKTYLEDCLPKGGLKLVQLDQLKLSNLPVTNPQRVTNANSHCFVIFTSGSTGRPKGVQMDDAAMVNMLVWQQKQFEQKCERHVLQFASLNFDVSFQEIFSTLCFGGFLHLIDEEERKDGNLLIDILRQQKISHLFLPFVVLENLAETAQAAHHYPTHLKEVITAGEQLKLTKSIADFVQKTGSKLVNQYGPTESHVVSAYEVLPTDFENRLLPPIGKPISNTQLYVLDANRELCSVKVAGELYIGGHCLATGYINREGLTNERFIQKEINGALKRLYRTGDLVRWMPDGNLEYIGRSDDQVKIRGNRVELGEIEAVLHKMPAVNQCVVVAKPDANGIKRLIAYVVAEQTFDKEAIADYLKSQVPDYMIPSLFVEMTEIPVTANGKADKRQLPAPDATALLEQSYTAPRNEIEHQLVEVWGKLLHIDQVGIYDNFFELGGHSLLATRVVSAIRTGLETELSLKELFTYPTIAKLANLIATRGQQVLMTTITVQKRPERIPLSFSQERLWFIDKLEGSASYHMSAAFRLKGEVDVQLLESVLQEIVNRHEILRTVLKEQDGVAYQLIKPKGCWKLDFITDMSDVDLADLGKWIAKSIRKPFDLSQDHMLRVELLKIKEQEYILVPVLHHIAADGWSVSLFINEMVQLYQAKSTAKGLKLPVLPIQYADYAIYQRKLQEEENWQTKLNYWTSKLAGTSPLNLPTDFKRKAEQSTNGDLLSVKLDKDLSIQLQALSKREGATLYMTMLAAFKVLLYRYTGQEDICVGSPIANRTQKELEPLIGFFVNTLALRSDLSGEPTFKDLLANIKNTTLDAYTHQEIPFEQIVLALDAERTMNQNPLFQVLFVLQNNPESLPLSLGEVQMIPEDYPHETSKFDLAFNIAEEDEALSIHVEYCSDLFHATTIQRMIEHYQNLLISIVKKPSQSIASMPMLTLTEIKQLRLEFNDTVVAYPEAETLISLVEKQAQQTPENTAIVWGEALLSYQELDEKANQLAHYLQRKGVVAGDLVGVCMDRSFEMIIGILGILKVGAAYVPIDPNYPRDRVHYILEDAKASFVICKTVYRELLASKTAVIAIEMDLEEAAIGQESTTALSLSISPDSLAYVIYTSGSTGKPKGVMISHENAKMFICWCHDEFANSAFEIVYGLTSICFDLSVFEIFFTLSRGKKLRMLDNALTITEWLKKDQHILLNTVPSVIGNLLEQHVDFSNVNLINMAGEPIPSKIPEKLDLERLEVRNLYGPSEDTTYSTVFLLKAKEPILIGRPIANTQIYIVDAHMQLAPLGAVGELCIGGKGLSKGYLGRSELTKEKFIAHPFLRNSKSKIYRTGDLARWRPDGQLEYLGRIDDQVKIRGYRIEPAEIEVVLQQATEVKKCVVLAKTDKSGSKHLIAYVVPEQKMDKEVLQDYLKQKLPEYMVPSLFMELEEMPMTPNGKIDKKALPNLDSALLRTTTYVVPQNELEEKLVELWQELLKREKVGVYDNFFELGGHSLMATRLATLIQKEFELNIPIKALFKFTCIAELSKYIRVIAKEQQQAQEEEEDFDVFEI